MYHLSVALGNDFCAWYINIWRRNMFLEIDTCIFWSGFCFVYMFLYFDTCTFWSRFCFLCRNVQKSFLGQLIRRNLYSIISKIVQKGTPKWRECIYSNEKPKSFQGYKAVPGPQPIRAHFVCMTPLHSLLRWTNISRVPSLPNPGSSPGISVLQETRWWSFSLLTW